MDYKILKKQLMVAMRCKQSQMTISRRMGFTFNQVYRWESHLVRMQWTDFLDFTKACRKNASPAVQHILGFKGDPKDTQSLIEFIFSTSKTNAIAKVSGRSSAVVKNWMSGRTQPSCEDILEFADRFHFCLLEMIATFVDVQSVLTLKSVYQRNKTQKETIYRYPQSDAVSVALLTPEYTNLPTHQTGVLAKLVGISKAEEISVIEAMSKAELIYLREGKYVPAPDPVDTQGNYKGSVQVRKYWTKRLMGYLENYEPSQKKSYYGYCLVSLSEEADRELTKAYYEFFAKVKTIFATDQAARTTVKLVATQLLDLPESAQATDKHRAQISFPEIQIGQKVGNSERKVGQVRKPKMRLFRTKKKVSTKILKRENRTKHTE